MSLSMPPSPFTSTYAYSYVIHKYTLLQTSCLRPRADIDVKNARCYDPNEEAKLRHVIGAVGEQRFNDSIIKLSQVSGQ